MEELFGYVPPEERSRAANKLSEQVVCSLDRPLASMVIADEGLDYSQTVLDEGLFYFEFFEQVTGKKFFPWTQRIGDCVSFGWGLACEHLMLCDIMASGNMFKFVANVATEPIYALSRVEVGKGRLGNSDGSIGSWAAKAVTDYGVHLRVDYGVEDLTTYSGSRAKDWGYRGCPDNLEAYGKNHKVGEATLVTTYDQMLTLYANLNAGAVCSNQGFTKRRNSLGVCDPSGSWAHCMNVSGFVRLKNRQRYVCITNSWGDYLGSSNSRIVTYSGREVELPGGTFLADEEVFERRMLRGQDTFCISGITGWKGSPSR